MNLYRKFCVQKFSLHYRTMRELSQVVQQVKNSLTGATEWGLVREDIDYHREIARSAFADMLHDTERNKKYESALKVAIDHMHSKGKPANVLDIGAGTGLLSIMAVRNGADSVIACEAFHPIAECARVVMSLNGVSSKITLITKRSTDLKVGDDGDMQERANILVSEVFDTELIGEGAIITFMHAREHLLTSDCIIVPEAAIVYAQVVSCPSLQKWNKVNDLVLNNQVVLCSPDKVKECAGSASVHDIQLNQLSTDLFKPLSNPIPTLYFDWKNGLATRASLKSVFEPIEDGTAQMVFVWWDLLMDINGTISISCAPWWARPKADPKDTASTIPWRDHWMQAVYYFPKEIPVFKGSEANLISCHDEYSLWFQMETEGSKSNHRRRYCECGVHMISSRTHLSYMNNVEVSSMFLKHLKEIVDGDSIVLDLNGNSIKGLAASKFGAKKLYIMEDQVVQMGVIKEYAELNNIKNYEFVSEGNMNFLKEVTHIIQDPSFPNALLPWQSLKIAQFLEANKEEISRDVKVVPGRFSLYAMPVEFLDLHKIRVPLGSVEGIDHSVFDLRIENARQISDDELEPQPLWEYPCYCRGEPKEILTIDFTQLQSCYTAKETLYINSKADCNFIINGFAVWSTWTIGDEVLNCGPLAEPKIGHKVDWYTHARQAVRLLPNVCDATPEQKWSFDVKCDLSNSTFTIKTDLVENPGRTSENNDTHMDME